jgi:tRNA threonylcarbamoyl adenosine modification protein YjeE
MAISKVFHVKNEADLAEVAAEIAPKLSGGSIMALEGDLGAGKTALTRAIIRHLTGNPELDVPSPTFTLVQTYDTPKGELWHFDLYRLKHPEEIFEIGWEDALSSGGIIIIEWPERIATLLSTFVIRVAITIEADKSRSIKVTI